MGKKILENRNQIKQQDDDIFLDVAIAVTVLVYTVIYDIFA